MWDVIKCEAARGADARSLRARRASRVARRRARRASRVPARGAMRGGARRDGRPPRGANDDGIDDDFDDDVEPPRRATTRSPVRFGMAPHPTLCASVPEDLKNYGRRGRADAGTHRCPCAHAARDETRDDDDARTCAGSAMETARRGFAAAYATRAGISLAAHVVRTLRRGSARKCLDLGHLVGEETLRYREDAARFGLFAGGFAGTYSATRCWLCYVTAPSGGEEGAETVEKGAEKGADAVVERSAREPFTPESAASIAGGVAGLSIFFLKPKYRRAFSLYLLAKLAQASWASAQKEHPWMKERGPAAWRHTNFALFTLSSAQIMYAYVMRPDTLDPGFWNFIVNAGPIDKQTLGAVRESVRSGASAAVVGCDHTHGSTGALWCSSHVAASSFSTFKKCFPFYFSIHYVPYVVLNLSKAVQKPLSTLYRATKATVRSSTMISTYVGLYMSTVCLHRNSGLRDHRALYYLAGVVASGALLVEDEGRRTDLTLWIVPRAVDSLVLVLVHKGILPHVANFESYLFALVMSGVMNLYEREPDVLERNLTRFIARFVEPPTATSVGRLSSISRDASVSLM